MVPLFLSQVLDTLISVRFRRLDYSMSALGSQHTIELEPIDEQLVASLSDELLHLASSFSLTLDDAAAQLCVEHLLYVQQINSYMNLTRITDVHEALTLHILDSLALAQILPSNPTRFLDMGTGAGFPGIPFHVLTRSSGVLLDSVGKKIAAVNACIKQLGLKEIIGVHARLEEFALKESHSFDVVLARAVGQLPLLLEYGTPFLSDDGYLVLAKAFPSEDERSSGLKAASLCGLNLLDVFEFDLPGDLGHRSIFLFRKVKEPSVRLPRPVGIAKKNPLG